MPENILITAIGDVPGLAGGQGTAALPVPLYWTSWNFRAVVEGTVMYERISYQSRWVPEEGCDPVRFL